MRKKAKAKAKANISQNISGVSLKELELEIEKRREKMLAARRKPRKPSIPSETFVSWQQISFYDGGSLFEILAQIPVDIFYNEMELNHEWSGQSVLKYKKSEQNKHYDEEMIVYQKKLKRYEQRMIIYKKRIAEWETR